MPPHLCARGAPAQPNHPQGFPRPASICRSLFVRPASFQAPPPRPSEARSWYELVGHLPRGVPYWAASDGEVPHVTASERSAAPLERRREESARTTEPIAECTGSPVCPCPSLTGCG